MTGGSIGTTGNYASGIFGYIFSSGSTGDVWIELKDNGSIETAGQQAHGIYGNHTGGSGDLVISLADTNSNAETTSITTEGNSANGIYGRLTGAGSITIDVTGGQISTGKENDDGTVTVMASHGIFGDHEGASGLTINLTGGDIATIGGNSYGIYGSHAGEGALSITMSGGSIDTDGISAHGLHGYHEHNTALAITMSGGTIQTGKVNTDGSVTGNSAYGIHGRHAGEDLATSSLTIGMTGGSIMTGGGHGIAGVHRSGTIDVTVSGGRIVTTGSGANHIHFAATDAARTLTLRRARLIRPADAGGSYGSRSSSGATPTTD